MLLSVIFKLLTALETIDNWTIVFNVDINLVSYLFIILVLIEITLSLLLFLRKLIKISILFLFIMMLVNIYFWYNNFESCLCFGTVYQMPHLVSLVKNITLTLLLFYGNLYEKKNLY
jgi:hypothetical protein